MSTRDEELIAVRRANELLVTHLGNKDALLVQKSRDISVLTGRLRTSAEENINLRIEYAELSDTLRTSLNYVEELENQ